jgi:1,4-dihydroxy-6-naphthoate synthase
MAANLREISMQQLTLGYSPCPNDTFIFYAFVHAKINIPNIHVNERLEDVETLNQLALAGQLDLTKVSYHAFGHLRDEYALLHSGGALGRGCGPLIIARENGDIHNLRGKKIAIPGELTTANLLLQLYDEGFNNTMTMPFDQIMPALKKGKVDAGVIIHESRFTYQKQGFVKLLDLGEWWEEDTGCPIPLGGILARRSLGEKTITAIDNALKNSIQYAYAHTQETQSYIKAHAQELEEQVINSHIGLYVNDYSLDLGTNGINAVETLLKRAHQRGLIPASTQPLFCS